MAEITVVPKHLFVSEGKIYPNSQGCIKNYSPKVIQYKHTIRVISPFNCNHEHQLHKNTKQNHIIHQKEKLIQNLKSQLKQKMQLLSMKDEQIQRLREENKKQTSKILRNSYIQNKLHKSEVTDIFKSNVQHSLFEGANNTFNIKTSYIFDMASSSYFHPMDSNIQNGKQSPKVDYQFTHIQKTLSDLENILKKPRKKYDFFMKKKQQNISIPQQIEKLNLNCLFNSKPQLLTSHTQQNQIEELENQSLDNTSANQSFDTTMFLEQAINEHQLIKQALIQLEQKTEKEMQQLKFYYEGQIQMYRKLLEKEKEKNKKNIVSYDKQIFKREFDEILQASDLQLINQSRLFDND